MKFGRTTTALLLAYLCSNIEIVNGDEISQDDYNPDDEAPLQIAEEVLVRISSNEEKSDVLPVVLPDGGKQYKITKPGSSYISAHFANFDLDPKCSMELADDNGEQVTIMHKRGRENLGTFWGHHVEGDTMIMTLRCDEVDLKAEFSIDEYAAGYPDGHPATENRKRGLRGGEDLSFPPVQRDLSICTANDKQNAKCYESSYPTEYTKAKAVARLVVNGMYGCTGWLVGPNNLLLTNYHCIKTTADAMNTDYQFMFESTTCSSNTVQNMETFDALSLVHYNSNKDYSLIQLDGDAVTKYGYLEMDNRVPSVGEKIFIPQHAGARDKEIAIFDTSVDGRCEVKSTTTGSCRGGGAYNDVYYSCDTEGGSSGAPVLSVDTGKVVALHHCGGGCSGNKGVPIAEIYEELSSFIYHNDAAVMIDQIGMTDFSLMPVAVVDQGGDSVRFQVTNTFHATATMYTTYKAVSGDYVCHEEQDLAPGGTFDLTASCLRRDSLSVVYVYVSYPDLVSGLDNASIHQCCHAPEDGNPAVQYTFQLMCDNSDNEEGRSGSTLSDFESAPVNASSGTEGLSLEDGAEVHVIGQGN